ncbi:MAG: TldD/PmbA family protein, partial [Candidatus Hodarchaeota archaeon]
MSDTLPELTEASLSFLEKRGVDDAIVAANRSISHQIRFTKNEVNIAKRWQSTNLSVYLVKDKRIASTDLNDVSSIRRVTDALQDLLAFTNALEKNVDYQGIAEGPFDYQNIPQTFDPSMNDFSDYAFDHIEGSINSALEEGAKDSAGVLEWQIGKRFLKTTSNAEVNEPSTRFLFQIRSFLSPTESGQGICVGRDLSTFDAEQAGQNAAQLAVQSRGGKAAKGGTFNALLAPTVAGELMEKIISAANPFSIESGQSWLHDKIGQQILLEGFAAYDDGTIPNGFRSAKADSEGVRTRKTPLIENGILKGLIHNTSTAKKAGTTSTGNAGLVAPQNSNILVEPGDYHFGEMIAECKSPT